MKEAAKPLIAAGLWSSVNTCAIGINQHDMTSKIARNGRTRSEMRDVRRAHSFNKYCGDGFPARPLQSSGAFAENFYGARRITRRAISLPA
jgi:hypothetical protein